MKVENVQAGRNASPHFGRAWLIVTAALLTSWHAEDATGARDTNGKPVADLAAPSTVTGSEPAEDVWAEPSRPLEPSRWINAQKQRAREQLKGQKYDVLVVPVQAGTDSLDHRGRALLTYSLAQAVAARSDLRVADPGLIAKAFGLNARQIPDAEILQLAADLMVKKILVGTVIQDRKGHFGLRMRTLGLPVGDKPKNGEQVRIYVGNAFSDTSPPISGFATLRDTILADSGIRLRAPQVEKLTRKPPVLPYSVDELLSAGTATDAILALQLMGMLVPPDLTSRTRDQLFERSLALLDLVSEDSPTYNLLAARAMLYLGRRPAAVAVLGEPQNAPERALLAYANGNLESLTTAINDIPAGLLATFALIERERLRMSYGSTYDAELVEQTVEQEPLWGPLLAHALMDSDTWRPYTHVTLKVALDAMYPVSRFSLEVYATGRIAVGELPDEYDIAALLSSHIDYVDKSAPVKQPKSAQKLLALTPSDITDVYREMLAADVRAESWHRAARIGKPRAALELLEQYDSMLADHPLVVSARLLAYRYLGNDVTGAEKANVDTRIKSLARRTLDLVGAETPETVEFAQWGRWLYPDKVFANELEESRYVFRTDWPQLPNSDPDGMRPTPERESILRHCLAYTITDMNCLVNLHSSHLQGRREPDEEGASTLVAANMDRFVGHPDRLEFLSSALRRTGSVDAADQVYLDAIDAGSLQWAPYENIAHKLQRESRFEDALNTVLKYPGFENVDLEGAVVQSNRAYDFGSLLYWAGAYEQAAPLYEIAAVTRTGSGAEMASAQRLALIDGDYDLAEHHTARRIRRYQDKYAVRDMIGLSAIAGNLEQAWSVVNGFQPMFDEPEPWVGALVAHRASNGDIGSIVEWGYKDGRDGLGPASGKLSTRFAFLAYTLDRKPSADLGNLLRARKTGLPQDLMRDTLLMIGRELPAFEVRHRVDLPWATSSELDSLLVFAADALLALEKKDYATAFARLDEASRYYELREFLPTYAWAAAKTGQTRILKDYLAGARNFKRTLPDRSNIRNTLFDENLAEAMLLGVQGQVNDAIDRLKAANAVIMHNQDRYVLTRYQVMESARLLLEDTNDPSYREFALDLARRNAVIEPFQAYAHSFVVMLSPDRRERVISLARVLVLDPQSRCIVNADAGELDEAQRLAARGYPLPDSGSHAGI